MVRRNMQRVASVMENVEAILRGLTRGLDPGILDRGFGEMNGQAVSFYPKARALGVVLPSNSPGVHGLWVPGHRAQDAAGAASRAAPSPGRRTASSRR